jgi:cysteinyl-tRNA synthetase
LSNAATQIIEKFVDKNTINDLKDFLKKVDDLLGLKLSDTQDISDSQKKFIAKREIARKNNDWAESDNIRDALKEQSIAVNDTAYGPIWSRI